MKNQKNNIIRRICILSGVCLLVSAMAVLVSWQLGIHTSVKQAESYVDTLRALMPDPQGAVPEERKDNTMSAVSLDGRDFIGVVEIPRFGSALPVCGNWGRPHQYPCRFSGSIYDRTIQIGATSQKGQFDFYREISVGDTVLFTDMAGNRYTYAVTNLRYEKHADQATLQREGSALTLFIKNVYSFEYLIVFCDVFS